MNTPHVPSVTSKRRHVWLEEYLDCGWSNVTELKCDALGYCPIHGTDRKRITKIPNKGIGLGYAG